MEGALVGFSKESGICDERTGLSTRSGARERSEYGWVGRVKGGTDKQNTLIMGVLKIDKGGLGKCRGDGI